MFKLDSSGQETVLYSFQGLGASDGQSPSGGLVRDAAGNLYGTTSDGGAFGGGGTVFKVDSSGKETVLHSFGDSGDGVYPTGRLSWDAAGNLYGTASAGGAFGGGTVFKVDSSCALYRAR